VAQGWNLVTWPNELTGVARIAGIPGLTSIYGWDETTGGWDVWAAELPEEANTLKVLHYSRSYWFTFAFTTELPFDR
jgi:hypothetical protein